MADKDDETPEPKSTGKTAAPTGKATKQEGEVTSEEAKSTWTDEEGYEFDLTDGSDEYREKLHKDGKI